MPKGSEELTAARKEEIVSACAKLYENMGFKEITIKDIAGETSFTRTSVYNYFQTKEEIFLALLKREQKLWNNSLEDIYVENERMSETGFADAVASSLEARITMLKIMAMNHYDMEENSRIEQLAEFKAVYGQSLKAMQNCLNKFFPVMSAEGIKSFIYSFFPFLFGVYPYVYVTEKQREAMRLASVCHEYMSVHELVYSEVMKLLTA